MSSGSLSCHSKSATPFCRADEAARGGARRKSGKAAHQLLRGAASARRSAVLTARVTRPADRRRKKFHGDREKESRASGRAGFHRYPEAPRSRFTPGMPPAPSRARGFPVFLERTGSRLSPSAFDELAGLIARLLRSLRLDLPRPRSALLLLHSSVSLPFLRPQHSLSIFFP